MSKIDTELRSKLKELLTGGEVKVVIGYEAGSTPFKSTPLFAETPEEVDNLIWNPTCTNNLAVYLPQAAAKQKVAVVVKPCESKSVVELINEHQVERENVMVVAIPCPGLLNIDALGDIDLNDIKSVAWKDGEVAVTTTAGEVALPGDQAFMKKCLACQTAEPVIADVKIGESEARESGDPYAAVAEYEKMSYAERRAYWARQFEKCIRCYACRQVCPGCYCNECFVDKNGQIWASKATDVEANWFFHMTRMMHIAGRCTGCGECQRACPMGIPLAIMSKRMTLDVKEMFGSDPGADLDAAPVLGSFTPHDPDPCPEA